MASWDPLVAGAGGKLPDALIPKPAPRAAKGGSASSAPTMPTGGASSAVPAATSKPTSMPTVLGMVHGICATAQKKAFPGFDSKVQVVVTDKAGADYQNNSAMALFALLKASGLPEGIKSPRDTAERLAEQMKAQDTEGVITKLEVAGPGFINIFLSVEWLSTRVHSFVTDGVLPPPVEKTRCVVDFSSPNVAKEMHVGHLRSTIIGDCICRVLEYVGHDVDRVNHIGDWGTQFGMLIRHLKNVFPDFATKPPPIADLTQFYKESKKVFDEDAVFAKQAHEEVVALQAGDGQSRYAWGQICDVSRKEFEKVYSRLGVKLTEKGESYYNEYIPAVVAHLEEIGLAKEDGGAKLIFPPGTKHENPLIVVKSDGGYGYDSTDMAAIWYRVVEQRADWVMYVTDAGQASHFELVFASAIAAGWTRPQTRLDHVPFGMVCGSDGKKYKTRSGETTKLVDLLDEAVDGAMKELTARKEEQIKAAREGGRANAANMSDEEMKNAAAVLGYGAVKYADLKSNRISNYIFSYERMLDPRGNTAVYLLYAGARIASILRTAEQDKGVDFNALLASGVTVQLVEPAELALGRGILRFQEVVETTLASLLPSTLCDYLYELCNLFTKFYQACKVIGSPEMGQRCLLLLALEKVLRQGYSLVGIGYLERI